MRSVRAGLLRPHAPTRRCCSCARWVGAGAGGDPNKRVSFVTIVVCLVVVQVIVSCVLVWLLGYLSTQNTVASLTRTIRQSVMHDVSFELNQAMKEPLQAASDLNALLNLRFPDLSDRTSITQDPGWMADVSYVCMRYPALSRVGFATRNNVYVLITKGIQSSGTGQPRFSSLLNQTVSFAQPTLQTVAGANISGSTVTLLNFRPTLIHPESSEPPFRLLPEVRTDDSPSAIARYLGSSFGPIANFSVTGRPFYTAAVDVASQGLLTGWSNVYSSSNPQTGTGTGTGSSSFLAIAAVHAHTVADGSLGFVSFGVTNLDALNQLLKDLPLGDNGFGLFVRTSGRVVSSSVPAINLQILRSVTDIDMFSSSDDWLRMLTPILLGWDLITPQHITPRNSSLVIPYRADVYETSVTYRGDTYHVQAAMISNVDAGLPLTSVIVTKDSDFDGNVRANNINTVALSVVVAVLSVVLSFLVTRCVSRPMMGVVSYMERACQIMELERSAKQRKELALLCDEWSNSSGMVLPPLLTSPAFVSMALKQNPKTSQRFFCCGNCCDRQMGCTSCGGIGRSLREVQSMQRAFGSMIYTLASYDELEAINHAKRQFIRYIFHDVRETMGKNGRDLEA